MSTPGSPFMSARFLTLSNSWRREELTSVLATAIVLDSAAICQNHLLKKWRVKVSAKLLEQTESHFATNTGWAGCVDGRAQRCTALTPPEDIGPALTSQVSDYLRRANACVHIANIALTG